MSNLVTDGIIRISTNCVKSIPLLMASRPRQSRLQYARVFYHAPRESSFMTDIKRIAPTIEDLRQQLRASRAAMLEPVIGLPESLLQKERAVGPYSVAQHMAIRIEAENRALTLAQSIFHGRPVLYPLSRETYDRKAVRMRWGWDWAHLMRELYQQREETMWNLEDFRGPALHRRYDLHGQSLSPYEIFIGLAREEWVLSKALWTWRRSFSRE